MGSCTYAHYATKTWMLPIRSLRRITHIDVTFIPNSNVSTTLSPFDIHQSIHITSIHWPVKALLLHTISIQLIARSYLQTVYSVVWPEKSNVFAYFAYAYGSYWSIRLDFYNSLNQFRPPICINHKKRFGTFHWLISCKCATWAFMVCGDFNIINLNFILSFAAYATLFSTASPRRTTVQIHTLQGSHDATRLSNLIESIGAHFQHTLVLLVSRESNIDHSLIILLEICLRCAYG